MNSLVYRQRLNAWGWLGVLLFVSGPAVIGWQLAKVLTFAGYGEPDLVGLFLTSLMPALGAVLLLIGREYYDATEAAAKEAAQAKAYYEQRRS
ncbi:hypothetical protein [Paracoccus benzoatiresistens]|uniref:Uncharacterized protein n=1 Tax=Paracoccus benzoatiresistens TaxID=2997341 RepID=A0ABT4J9T6_9RHOB|nr:hypothetical protein [Paracoccus sp. EF6]MCZ0963892.1 hypothetical protein [Paracoccus sp. EF6]